MVLDGSVPDEDIKRMIGESYDLTGDCSKRDKSLHERAASGMVFNQRENKIIQDRGIRMNRQNEHTGIGPGTIVRHFKRKHYRRRKKDEPISLCGQGHGPSYGDRRAPGHLSGAVRGVWNLCQAG